MKIYIRVDNEDGELALATECLSIESAVQTLYSFERHQDKQKLTVEEEL